MNLKTDVPQIILGTMNFGRQFDEAAADRMLGSFIDRGYKEIDTAYGYADGAAEEILGRVLTLERREKVYLATKVNPLGGGGLRPESIVMQVDTSLRRLKANHVDLLYLHAPDPKTQIEVTLETCQKLFKEGKFRELGLSNYAAWQVADIWHLCRQNGWILPSVYQGMYNAITRDVEPELFPAIRNFGIRFYAYNPLAGGLLTGKYARFSEEPQEGRFKLQRSYIERYWKKSYFEALEVIQNTSEQAGVSMTQVALLWILHHSSLKGPYRDGVILAASSLDQWEANLKSLNGELPAEVAEAVDRAWQKARPDCPQYFRTSTSVSFQR
jgi:aflatoxin B1 aldehyde reductase